MFRFLAGLLFAGRLMVRNTFPSRWYLQSLCFSAASSEVLTNLLIQVFFFSFALCSFSRYNWYDFFFFFELLIMNKVQFLSILSLIEMMVDNICIVHQIFIHPLHQQICFFGISAEFEHSQLGCLARQRFWTAN